MKFVEHYVICLFNLQECSKLMLIVDSNWKLFKSIVDCLSHLKIVQKHMLKDVL